MRLDNPLLSWIPLGPGSLSSAIEIILTDTSGYPAAVFMPMKLRSQSILTSKWPHTRYMGKSHKRFCLVSRAPIPASPLPGQHQILTPKITGLSFLHLNLISNLKNTVPTFPSSCLNNVAQGFPGGAVVENLPANAGDTGSSTGLGRSHMPRSN